MVRTVIGTRWADPPTRVRWESGRLGEPLVLRRPWRSPWLERPDGTPLPVDDSGARWAVGSDGTPVRVAVALSFLQVGQVLKVDGRPVPSTAPVGKSTGLGVLTGLFVLAMLGGMVAAALGYAACFLTIAVGRCEGDPSTRRSQAAAVAVVGAGVIVAAVALGVLITSALGAGPSILWGLADVVW